MSNKQYMVIEFFSGKIVTGPLDFSEANIQASELAWKTGIRHAVVEYSDFNLKYTKEDVM